MAQLTQGQQEMLDKLDAIAPTILDATNGKPLTTHQLAFMLLAQPNEPAYIYSEEDGPVALTTGNIETSCWFERQGKTGYTFSNDDDKPSDNAERITLISVDDDHWDDDED